MTHSECKETLIEPETTRMQEGRRGFMSGVAELKAGPTQEQQNHARALREQLLADLQEQVPLEAHAAHHEIASCQTILSRYPACRCAQGSSGKHARPAKPAFLRSSDVH